MEHFYTGLLEAMLKDKSSSSLGFFWDEVGLTCIKNKKVMPFLKIN
jgi:hypothetical protein